MPLIWVLDSNFFCWVLRGRETMFKKPELSPKVLITQLRLIVL